jgi:hypothetical protein
MIRTDLCHGGQMRGNDRWSRSAFFQRSGDGCIKLGEQSCRIASTARGRII